MRTIAKHLDHSSDVELPRDATLRLGRDGAVVRAERGTVLVTQAGDPEDHVLEAGEAIALPRGGAAVAWALSDARVRVDARERVVARVCR